MVFGTTEVMFERVGPLLYANEHRTRPAEWGVGQLQRTCPVVASPAVLLVHWKGLASRRVEVSVYVVRDFSLDHLCIIEVTARRSGISACYTATTNSSCWICGR